MLWQETVLHTMNRRQFTSLSVGTVASVSAGGRASIRGEGFFSLRQGKTRWRLSAPDDSPFFSLGLNQIDAAPVITVAEVREWKRHYGRDARQWIEQESDCCLERGGFNSTGTDQAGINRPSFHLVPFSVAGEWDRRERQCNYLRPDWEDWCDHLAKAHCAPRAEDRNLIGYRYSESPCWLSKRPQSEWRGPFFDPGMLRSAAGRRQLRLLARQYYRTTRDAILRYDPHHLIFGDCYGGAAPLPPEVYEEAVTRVDAFSFQDFQDPIANLRIWYELTRKPVLLADTGEPNSASGSRSGILRDPRWYASLLQGLLAIPGCVGCHLSGSVGLDFASLQVYRDVNLATEKWTEVRAG